MKPNAASSPRAQASQLLQHILQQKVTLDEALAERPLQGDAADTRFIMMLVLTTLRHLGQLDALVKKYLEKPLPDKRVSAQNALRLGVAQLLLMHTPAHAAIHETVELVKQGPDKGLSGLVNAVLQNISREQPAMPHPAHNIPQWLQHRWEHSYGKPTMKAIADVAAMRPPLDVCTRGNFAQGERLDAQVWRLPSDHEAVQELEGYGEGNFWVQDIAATYPARLLGEVKGLHVLDIGAAPGGKTAQLAKAGARITAVDKSAARMETLNENMARLKLEVMPVVADALQWNPAHAFDAVLLDAPCSATGTWRRHPEVLQVTTQHDIAELARLQRDLLKRAWSWVKPGGTLVYCTCSLEPEEGEHQASWFAEHHPDATLAKPTAELPPEAITTEGFVRTRPDMLQEKGGIDGFFAAAFRKA